MSAGAHIVTNINVGAIAPQRVCAMVHTSRRSQVSERIDER